MTWIKRLIFLAIVFFGLYYFGDFRVNEVNVRDYLQAKITKENLAQAKKFVVSVYDAAKSFYDSFQKQEEPPQKDVAEPDGKPTSTSVTVTGFKNPLDSISDSDKAKIQDLIKTNLGQK